MYRPPSFAWRCWQIKPRNSEWPEHNFTDGPKPPSEWEYKGFAHPWRVWRSGPGSRVLADSEVEPRKACSLLWCQRTQIYHVVLEDCTANGRTSTLSDSHEEFSGPEEDGNTSNWHILGCAPMLPPRNGIWRLVDVGTHAQHDSCCPGFFDEFLPSNFFRNQNDDECHLVGNLSLILALLAMCPEDPNSIQAQIDEGFYRHDEPRYVRTVQHGAWDARDKFGKNKFRLDNMKLIAAVWPGRALVMQTGVITADGRSTHEELRAWENGEYGPMVSSETPTEDEWKRWVRR